MKGGIVMKKVLCIIVIFMLLVSVTACASSSDKAVVLPPTRIGSSDIHATFEKRFTFNTAFSSADVVASVRVGNWIAEDVDLQKTYYKATVLQCFKGDLPPEFTLLQDGCSTGTFKGYPLFTNGNELLVFLNKATVTDYPSPYWIIGSFTTVMDITYDESGSRYYSDRHGILGETVDISNNYALQDNIFAELYSKSVANDSIVADMHYSYQYIFSESDLVKLIESR